ncbi:endonuclease domain-containing 1 protein-like [Neoarius graeffei]|uniref:endonuclease domain-containing 1 protein-like n=1 Tax=Neoarius graeffei TaxID=443677 RepID=UPI00298C4FC4|nr:endonuclease domain-containing 1 protein-like [Neoarius graeffei]
MIILALFIFMTLAEVPIWAEVVNNFNGCRKFFYEHTEPQGMDQNAKKICQKYNYGGYFYASLYSTYHKIPVYSAYLLDNNCRSQDGRKSSNWFIEPQLSGISDKTMQPESKYDRDLIKSSQALNDDYSNTGYDRGHLNPNSFQCEDGREATFTLTNSAPMDACFNRVHWKQWEQEVRRTLSARSSVGTAYLVTGTVPSKYYKIPRQGVFDKSGTRDFDRVTVPTHVWTAVCYKNDADDELSFSFGYIGQNQPDSRISIMSVPQLNQQLSSLYHTDVKIFQDDCFSNKRKSEETIKYLYKHIQLPFSDKLEMSDDVQNKLHTAISQSDTEGSVPLKRPRLTGVIIHETFNSLKTWFEKIEGMKYVSGLTCVLSQQFTGPIKSLSSTGIQRRDTADDSQELVCSLVPEEVRGCTTSCLYKEEARGYYCYDKVEEKSCSPEYSIITVSGKTCNSNDTCGKHGYDYYWCWEGDSWEYCSPPLPMGKGKGGKSCRSNHNCAFYGYGYTWCYTDYNDNWDYCCKISDNLSALNGKTCKPDHPCGYHGYNYLWCYTTDGSSEYCCTQ